MNQNQQESPGNGSIVLCPDGPILVRGDFDIVASSGNLCPGNGGP